MQDYFKNLMDQAKKDAEEKEETKETEKEKSEKKQKLDIQKVLEKPIESHEEMPNLLTGLRKEIAPDILTEEEIQRKQILESAQKQRTENEKTTFDFANEMKKMMTKENELITVKTNEKENTSFEEKEKTLLASYDNNRIQIFKIKGSGLPVYVIPMPQPTINERNIVNTLKEAATRIITIDSTGVKDPEQKRMLYFQKIIEILQKSPELNIPKTRFNFYADIVVKEMVGYGIIDDLIRDDELEEIMVVGPNVPVYLFHRKHGMLSSNIIFYSENQLQDLINRIAREIGRRVDIAMPLLDARLPDGSRVNATMPPASVDFSTLTIRKFRQDPYSVIDLIKFNTLSVETAAFLWMSVDGLGVKPANTLISGGTGSGKTTLLNVMASFIPEGERIISIEDIAELNLPLKHWIRLEARPPSLEGAGEITLDELTKNSLRMRPDRIIVGEVRHAEAFTLLTAMNTGHEGAIIEGSLVQKANGLLERIENLSEPCFKENAIQKQGLFEFVEPKKEIKIIAIDKTNFQEKEAIVEKVWRRNIETELMKIKLASGKEITLTKDHPIFRMKNGFVEQVHAKECLQGEYIASVKNICAKKKIKNIVPGTGLLVKTIRQTVKMTQKELEKKIGLKTRSSINAIECNKRNPSKEMLKKINFALTEEFNKKIKTCEGNEQLTKAKQFILHLNSVLNENILWEKIMSIEENTSNKVFYDFTLNNYNTYIANGIMVSNCMGTVHANSPQETVVRLTSPPMNVPEIMMAGLDLVVLEHKIHDKKKGLIRRITSISEVKGALEGKATTDPVYERDPVKDIMERSALPSNYLHELMEYTGKNESTIESELQKRTRFLEALQKKDISALKEVNERIQGFMLEN